MERRVTKTLLVLTLLSLVVGISVAQGSDEDGLVAGHHYFDAVTFDASNEASFSDGEIYRSYGIDLQADEGHDRHYSDYYTSDECGIMTRAARSYWANHHDVYFYENGIKLTPGGSEDFLDYYEWEPERAGGQGIELLESIVENQGLSYVHDTGEHELADSSPDELKFDILCHDRSYQNGEWEGGNWLICDDKVENHNLRDDYPDGVTTANGEPYVCEDGEWSQASEEELQEHEDENGDEEPETDPEGDEENQGEIEVKSCSQLQDIEDLTKDISLEEDIDCDGENFEPLGLKHSGDAEEAFEGTFDGDDNTISGLKIVHDDATDVGLFEVIGDEGKVKNLNIDGSLAASIDGAGLVAHTNRGTIQNVEIRSSLVAKGEDFEGITTNTGSDRNGGVVRTNEGEITDVKISKSKIEGSGIADTNRNKIEDVEVINSKMTSVAGGIARLNDGEAEITGSEVRRSEIIGDRAGGIVSLNRNLVKESEVTESIIDTTEGRRAGGIAGEDQGGEITESEVERSNIEASARAGGLVGWYRGFGSLSGDEGGPGEVDGSESKKNYIHSLMEDIEDDNTEVEEDRIAACLLGGGFEVEEEIEPGNDCIDQQDELNELNLDLDVPESPSDLGMEIEVEDGEEVRWLGDYLEDLQIYSTDETETLSKCEDIDEENKEEECTEWLQDEGWGDGDVNSCEDLEDESFDPYAQGAPHIDEIYTENDNDIRVRFTGEIVKIVPDWEEIDDLDEDLRENLLDRIDIEDGAESFYSCNAEMGEVNG